MYGEKILINPATALSTETFNPSQVLISLECEVPQLHGTLYALATNTYIHIAYINILMELLLNNMVQHKNFKCPLNSVRACWNSMCAHMCIILTVNVLRSTAFNTKKCSAFESVHGRQLGPTSRIGKGRSPSSSSLSSSLMGCSGRM